VAIDYAKQWTAKALAASSALRLDRELIRQTPNIVARCVGADWLATEGASDVKGAKLQEFIHPFGTLLRVVQPQSIVEFAELATYLKAANAWPGYAALGGLLRTDYHGTMLQLAAAYRFFRAGATKIRLEPETPKGKADIAFDVDGESFIVECYQPRYEQKKVFAQGQILCQTLFKVFATKSAVIDIGIAMQEPLTQQIRVELQNELRGVAKTMPQQGPRGANSAAVDMVCFKLRAATFYVAKVHRKLRLSAQVPGHSAFKPPRSTPDETMVNSQIQGDRIQESMAGKLEIPWVRVRIWFDSESRKGADTSAESTRERLIKKIRSHKLPQTKGTLNEHRVLVVETPILNLKSKPNDALLGITRQQIIDRHPGVHSVLYFNRHYFRNESRWRYSIYGVARVRHEDEAPFLKALFQLNREQRIPDLA
jgi:hypothetical protein